MNEIPNSRNRDRSGWIGRGTSVIGIAFGTFAEMVVNDPTSLRAKLVWLLDCPEDVTRPDQADRQRVLLAFTWPAVVRHCLDVCERGSLIGDPGRQGSIRCVGWSVAQRSLYA